MQMPDGYCYIKTHEEARDRARETKRRRGQTWREFLNDAAEALDPESDD